MKKITKIPRVTAVEIRPPFGLHLTFNDGVVRDVDLTRDVWGPMFEPLQNPEFFAQVAIKDGTVAWPNGLDLDPLVLHGDFEPDRRASDSDSSRSAPR